MSVATCLGITGFGKRAIALNNSYAILSMPRIEINGTEDEPTGFLLKLEASPFYQREPSFKAEFFVVLPTVLQPLSELDGTLLLD